MCMLQTWATVVKDASELTNEELRASFDLIDVDGNGRLNVKELEVRDRPHSNLTLPPPSPPMRAPCGPPTPHHGPNHRRRSEASSRSRTGRCDPYAWRRDIIPRHMHILQQ